MSHIPAHLTAITPYLSVQDAPGFIDFLTRAFGAKTLARHEDDGAIRHAEVQIEGFVVEISEAREAWPATRCGLHLFVADPDAALAAAIDAGAAQTYPMTTHPYGERSGGVRDRWGNDWFIARVTDLAARG